MPRRGGLARESFIFTGALCNFVSRSAGSALLSCPHVKGPQELMLFEASEEQCASAPCAAARPGRCGEEGI